MKSLFRKALWVKITFSIMALAFAALLIVEIQMLHLLSDLEAGLEIDEAVIDRLDARTAVAGITGLVSLVPCIVFYCIWIASAYANLERGGLCGLRNSPSKAVVSYFIPIVGLFWPVRIMSEMWKGSSALAEGSDVRWEQRETSPIVAWWWMSLILGTVTERVESRLWNRAEEAGKLDQFTTAQYYGIASTVLTIAAAVLAIFVVMGVTRLQQAAIERKAPPAVSS